MQCSVCGGSEFIETAVLWEVLINEWQLSREEVAYIDRQQGQCCKQCNSNLRSIALANAIRAFLGTQSLFRDLASSQLTVDISILEINEAGNLTSWLKQFGHYTYGAYPELDMRNMPFAPDSFDLIVHSDTLEHIYHPIDALAECRRVLKINGALCFTVPIIIGRMSRDRSGLPRSFHGNHETAKDDFVVQTEFGADAWTYPLKAGFTDISIHSVGFPAATAMLARNGWMLKD